MRCTMNDSSLTSRKPCSLESCMMRFRGGEILSLEKVVTQVNLNVFVCLFKNDSRMLIHLFAVDLDDGGLVESRVAIGECVSVS